VISLEQVDRWLAAREDEHVELKEAKRSFSFDELVRYCAALANEGGGHVVLGISPKIPRRVVGSEAFRSLPKVAHDLLNRVRLRIQVDEACHPDGRVVVFTVPSRPVGMAVEVDGQYWMRAGESLTGMTPDRLRTIFAETTPDFSAQPCLQATASDLEPSSIAEFRARWARKSGDPRIAAMSDDQALSDAGLVVDGVPTYAALVLLGSWRVLLRHLPQAEVVFEYRSSDATGPAQQRLDLREGFFAWYDRLWAAVNARNDLQHYQEGLFVWDIPTFDEGVVRELVLNAVSHRDYRLQGSVFVRQYPRRLEITSPGGLPPGVTVENILWKQAPGNQRICEAFQRCGLVERSGQGMNRVVERCVLNSNPMPEFKGTDAYQVSVTINGVVEDPRFVSMLSRVSQEQLERFGTEHFLALSVVHREGRAPDSLRVALEHLVDLGLVEKARRGRHILSRRLYAALGQPGVYTRRVGLDRDTNKQLLLKHIRESGEQGARMEELMQVLPALTRGQVKSLVSDLKRAGLARPRGRTRAAVWLAIDETEPNQIQSPPNGKG